MPTPIDENSKMISTSAVYEALKIADDENQEMGKTIAQSLNVLNDRCTSLENRTNYGNLSATSITLQDFPIVGGGSTVITSNSSNTVIPDFQGQFFINSAGDAFISKGYTSSSDWIRIDNADAIPYNKLELSADGNNTHYVIGIVSSNNEILNLFASRADKDRDGLAIHSNYLRNSAFNNWLSSTNSTFSGISRSAISSRNTEYLGNVIASSYALSSNIENQNRTIASSLNNLNSRVRGLENLDLNNFASNSISAHIVNADIINLSGSAISAMSVNSAKSAYYAISSTSALSANNATKLNNVAATDVIGSAQSGKSAYNWISSNSGFILNDEPLAIAESLNTLNDRCTSLEQRTNYGNLSATSITLQEFPLVANSPMILTGSAAPTIKPEYLGQFYATSGGNLYFGKNYTSTSDWIKLDNSDVLSTSTFNTWSAARFTGTSAVTAVSAANAVNLNGTAGSGIINSAGSGYSAYSAIINYFNNGSAKNAELATSAATVYSAARADYAITAAVAQLDSDWNPITSTYLKNSSLTSGSVNNIWSGYSAINDTNLLAIYAASSYSANRAYADEDGFQIKSNYVQNAHPSTTMRMAVTSDLTNLENNVIYLVY